jgi:hypothetical protein
MAGPPVVSTERVPARSPTIPFVVAWPRGVEHSTVAAIVQYKGDIEAVATDRDARNQ